MENKAGTDLGLITFFHRVFGWETGFPTKSNISLIKNWKIKIFCFENASCYLKHTAVQLPSFF